MAGVFPGFIGHNELIKIGKISLVIMSTLFVRKLEKKKKRQAEDIREYKVIKQSLREQAQLSFILVAM